MSTLVGDWTIKWETFSPQFNLADIDAFTQTTLPPEFGGQKVDDLSATVDEKRNTCPPYLRVVPFGPSSDAIHSVIQDGDILTFVFPKIACEGPVEVLKQRGWHTEIGYLDGLGHACQIAVWGGGIIPRMCNDCNQEWIIHILRVIIPGVPEERVLALKKQVRLWKEIFNKHEFPNDGDQYTGSHRYLDPADFGTVEEIEGIARSLICRTSDIMPNVPKVTCVQWAYTVLCLSLIVPLNERSLVRLGVWDAYKRNWEPKLGLSEPDLVGIDVLPFVPFSPAEVMQSFLDTYFEGLQLVEALRKPMTRLLLENILKQQAHEGLPELVSSYFDEIVESGDIAKPLQVPGRPPYRFVMPITFFSESRAACKKPASAPWFQYVGTAIHESFVCRATQ